MIQVPLHIWSEITGEFARLVELMQSIPSAKSPDSDNSATEPSMAINPKVWYDNADLCQMLNVSKHTAQRWRTDKKIKYTILCGKANYLGCDILTFIQVYGKQHRISFRQINKEIPKGRL